MGSFTDLMAQRILQRREEFLAGLSSEPNDHIESFLATSIQNHWHPFEAERLGDEHLPLLAAVDGSRAIRALNVGAEWIIAQALLIGPDGLRLSSVDTLLLRGEIERPAIDRCASLIMRSLELDLALKFVQSGAGNVLLLDGSLYADLPYLLYHLAIGGYEDLPLKVLEQYLELFELCQKNNVLLLGISKSARSAVLGRALLESPAPSIPQLAASPQLIHPDTQEEVHADDIRSSYKQHVRDGMQGLPTDGELLHRWTRGIGLTDPVLLGSTSFGHDSAQMAAKLAPLTQQPLNNPVLQPNSQRARERLHPLQERLLAASAIGTFYVRLAPGDDALRVDALAGTFGRKDLRLLAFAHTLVSYTTALPIVQRLLGDYGGLSVYNAALYVVDQEVRLHAETVDHVYLQVLQHQIGLPIRYDRSTRRFIR